VKLAFIVLAHRFPQQVRRLAERLSAPNARLYVHADRGMAGGDYAALRRALAQREDVTWLERLYSRWGSFALVKAELAGLRRALADGCDYALLLSGQDYPLRPIAVLDEFLAANAGKSFIQVRPLPDGDWPREGAARVTAWNFVFEWPEGRLARRLERGLARVFNRIWPERKLAAGLTLRGGSQWWCLHARCAEQVLAFARSASAAAFRHTIIPDESFFQTALWNSPRRAALQGANLTYMDWNGPPFPRTLGLEHFDRLANSEKLFARKFDPVQSAALMDRIDAELL
jgi:hypothetical protein